MLGNIGPLEIIVVLIIALVVFGPKRLPELGNSLGKGIREFKDSVTGDHHDEDTQEEAAKPIAPPKVTTTQVKPATTHRIEADKVEAGPDSKV
ncbi:MAG: twin-arginine translocation protein TatA/E family subunit [Solirubrobacterales bacterium]|nr:twin-arginine translocation protein TatA/E family subunit [Solirubrobacterales bacterium]